VLVQHDAHRHAVKAKHRYDRAAPSSEPAAIRLDAATTTTEHTPDRLFSFIR